MLISDSVQAHNVCTQLRSVILQTIIIIQKAVVADH
jgi:hypothetical protein